MASVTSLDHDVRAHRLARYTPQAAQGLRAWIEQALGEKLAPGDLLDALKDGVALCHLANMVLPPPGIKFKKSAMPFVQMENISQFLKACTMSPLDLHSHDRFLTVDLYESKDPAQVIQCLSAFTRQAHAAYPDRFPDPIGPKKAPSRSASPVKQLNTATQPSARTMSPTLTGESFGSPNSPKMSGTVSSWSKKKDEGATVPAWNIHQYGYMGGASQGNQGINFGVRRQITSAAPRVPNLAEKERTRKEKAAEEEKLRQKAEEDEIRRQAGQKAVEERAKEEEQRRWEEETRRQRDEERRRIEEQKRQWEEQERQWKEKEELRKKEDAAMEATLSPKDSVTGRGILRGQSLADYQREQAAGSQKPTETREQARVRELEKQLEEARERERQYQAEREERLRGDTDRSQQNDTSLPAKTTRGNQPRESDASWIGDEREYLRNQWQSNRDDSSETLVSSTPDKQESQTKLPFRSNPPNKTPSSRPLPDPVDDLPSSPPQQRSRSESSNLSIENRPTPNPQAKYPAYNTDQAHHPSPFQRPTSQNPTPIETPTTGPRISTTQETGETSLEQHRDKDARRAAQTRTKAVAAHSKSLLEREMERERERQREWEANQLSSRTGMPLGSRETPAPSEREVNHGRQQSRERSRSRGAVGRQPSDGSNASGSSSSRVLQFGSRRPILGPRPQK
ncbi:Hypothetical protein R9X50_00464200 [Acrodontium crateriforme]|uniref:Calponin-homology (CH) domain-containing protein n=1 Tax=Acrodontium crateriforme TaxID=150365 RepID=A0AAQ3M500_9PEZI|nr:Hypothetical protein R9X50_00464200 [Acrodontium crateriforme]